VGHGRALGWSLSAIFLRRRSRLERQAGQVRFGMARPSGSFPLHKLERWTSRHGRDGAGTRRQSSASDVLRRLLHSGLSAFGLGNSAVDRPEAASRSSGFELGFRRFRNLPSYLAIKKWVHGPVSVYHLFNSFHEGRNAADPNWLRINQKLPNGCFYPYAELSANQLRDRRSQGNLVWWLSHHLRTVAMVQDYRDIFESLNRVRNKRQLTEALLIKMNETVREQGGKFTVLLFDMSPDERQDYRKFLESHAIAFVDCGRPELKDKKLRLPDGHPSGALHELVAQWMEPIQVPADRGTEAKVKNPAQ